MILTETDILVLRWGLTQLRARMGFAAVQNQAELGHILNKLSEGPPIHSISTPFYSLMEKIISEAEKVRGCE